MCLACVGASQPASQGCVDGATIAHRQPSWLQPAVEHVGWAVETSDDPCRSLMIVPAPPPTAVGLAVQLGSMP